MLSSSQTEDTPDNSSVISKSYGKFKNLLKFKKKSKSKIMDSKITFNNVHEQYGQRIQNNNVTEENSTTNWNFIFVNSFYNYLIYRLIIIFILYIYFILYLSCIFVNPLDF